MQKKIKKGIKKIMKLGKKSSKRKKNKYVVFDKIVKILKQKDFIKWGIFVGFVFGFLGTDFSQSGGFFRLFLFCLLGAGIGKIWNDINYQNQRWMFVFVLFFAAFVPSYIPFFTPNEKGGTLLITNEIGEMALEVEPVLNNVVLEIPEVLVAETSTDILFDSWSVPASTPIRTRFLDRADEYLHLPVITKKSIFPVVVNLKNFDTALLEFLVNGTLVAEKSRNEGGVNFELPLNLGKNQIQFLLKDAAGNLVTEKFSDIYRVEKVVHFYGDSLTTGYPENRVAGVDVFVRSSFDAEASGMVVSQNKLAIPTAAKLDAAYENRGLHIGVSDYFTQQGKEIFTWNEARNGETVYGQLLRFDAEGFGNRLTNVSEAVLTDLSADYVHLMLGTNDAREKESQPDFDMVLWEQNVNLLLDKILASGISATNIVISLSPNTEYETSEFKLIWEKIIGERGLTMGVDLTILHESHPDYFHADNVHFSAIGKVEVAKMIAARLNEVFQLHE